MDRCFWNGDLSRLRGPNRIIRVVLGNFGGNPAHDNISDNCNVNLFYFIFNDSDAFFGLLIVLT